MAIAVGWMIPDYVFVTYVWGEVTFAEFVDAVPPGIELVRSVTARKVHNWIDMRHVGRYPHDVRHMSRDIDIFAEPNLGHMLAITNNPMIRVIAQFAGMLRDKPVQMCRSVPEGLSYLATLDENMPTITAADYDALVQSLRNNPLQVRGE